MKGHGAGFHTGVAKFNSAYVIRGRDRHEGMPRSLYLFSARHMCRPSMSSQGYSLFNTQGQRYIVVRISHRLAAYKWMSTHRVARSASIGYLGIHSAPSRRRRLDRQTDCHNY